MKKILVTIFLMQSLISGCSANNFDAYKDEINELLQDPKDRKVKGNENDINDLSGCPVLFEQSWVYSKRWNSWSIDQTWFDGHIVHGTGIGTASKNEGSAEILASEGKKRFIEKGKLSYDTADYLIYIGPWKNVSFNNSTGFWGSSEIEQKEIRFYAYQSITNQVLGGKPVKSENIHYRYEEKTEQNKSIPEKPFSLSPQAKFAPDKFSLCVVKWTAKYGYNAVIDLHKNPWYPFFSKDYLVGSGKIIEAKE